MNTENSGSEALVALPVAAPPVAPAVPPLIERLVSVHGAVWLDSDSIEFWAGGAGDRVVLLSGDPVRFPEALDVAVVLPELQRAFAGRFQVGVAKRDFAGDCGCNPTCK